MKSSLVNWIVLQIKPSSRARSPNGLALINKFNGVTHGLSFSFPRDPSPTSPRGEREKFVKLVHYSIHWSFKYLGILFRRWMAPTVLIANTGDCPESTVLIMLWCCYSVESEGSMVTPQLSSPCPRVASWARVIVYKEFFMFTLCVVFSSGFSGFPQPPKNMPTSAWFML